MTPSYNENVYNLIPASHTSDVTLDIAKLIYGIIMKMDMNLGYLISHQISLSAQHDTSRLGFPALIIALWKARGVQSDSRSLENLSPAINLAYIKKNCWNLDDPTVTFRGPRKARGKRSGPHYFSTTRDNSSFFFHSSSTSHSDSNYSSNIYTDTTSSSFICRSIKFYFYTTDAAITGMFFFSSSFFGLTK